MNHMNTLDEALVIVLEECAEVQKSITKILRFGRCDSQCGGNVDKLKNELIDLYVTSEVLSSILLVDLDINSGNNRELYIAKVKKLLKNTTSLSPVLTEILEDIE